METPQISPCPVCGSADVELTWEYETFVHCEICGLQGKPVEGGLKSITEILTAIANWNRLPRLIPDSEKQADMSSCQSVAPDKPRVFRDPTLARHLLFHRTTPPPS